MNFLIAVDKLHKVEDYPKATIFILVNNDSKSLLESKISGISTFYLN